MAGSENSRRNALAMSIAWWYLRRKIRKRGTAALAGFAAGEGLSFKRRPRKRHLLRWLLLVGLVAGGGFWWWRRQQGGGDDWGNWEPVAPIAPVVPGPAEPAPEPFPQPLADPVAT